MFTAGDPQFSCFFVAVFKQRNRAKSIVLQKEKTIDNAFCNMLQLDVKQIKHFGFHSLFLGETMALTSTVFILFLILLVPVYYLAPKRMQWCILLIASLVFYIFSGWTNIFYVIGVTLIAFISTRFIRISSDSEKVFLKDNKDTLTKDEKKTYKANCKKRRKRMMLGGILPIIFLLVLMKFLRPVNNLLSVKGFTTLNIIVPLGLSYYTLQVIGYIVDVYWNRVAAEKNFLKLLLFVSFFPQVTQGPINDYADLSSQLFAEHSFTYRNFSYGFQRMIWGYFKKLVVANIMASYAADLFQNYKIYTGITLFIGIFVVMIQLYADFSGYMDIVCGICEMLDIRLAENFNKPFFSKSLAEFWRRWHITLGAWFRKYVFFPVGTSRLSKTISKKIDGNKSDKLISTIALLVIWFSIGVWHSLTLPFVLWGLANGIIMIISVWLEDSFAKCRKILHIKEGAKWFNLFRIARTFTLVSLLEVFSDVGSLNDGGGYLVRILINSLKIPTDLNSLIPFVSDRAKLAFVALGLALMLIFSVLGIKKPTRDYFNRLPLIVRSAALAVAFCVIVSVGIVVLIENDGGFMYANF